MNKEFDFVIQSKPEFAFLKIQIPAGQTIKAEASSMAAMDTNVAMKTRLKGGFGRFLTGESIFINEFTAQGSSGEIQLAPGPSGDVGHYHLKNEKFFLQNGAFIASGMNVNLDTQWQGMMKGFFSGGGFFLIRCSGSGDLFFNSYGAIHELDIDGDYVVDTGYIVGFTEGLDYSIEKIGGYKSLFFSGEGLVCRFQGKGKVNRNKEACG
ncbi:MAG: TIGR00266 family protein [Cyclobacteriaceae bacterium]|nr:TIGR00266 family protein [Cyclobacteriaceae bacterium]